MIHDLLTKKIPKKIPKKTTSMLKHRCSADDVELAVLDDGFMSDKVNLCLWLRDTAALIHHINA
jgi:hypothetical protein